MDQMQQQKHADNGYDGGVPPASAGAQQEAAGLGKRHEQQHQQPADDGDVGDMPAASARAQQAAAGLGKKQEGTKEQQPASSLNPTAARLLREAIVSQPDGAAAAGSSDILAFARTVDRADSPLE